ncbi:phage antirepressor [Akkermansia muciniphila]|jgi:anti-repressor protein|uniref:phage antirepressor n=1 Tax=Akkermansia muciniphila TaxID=239935 RepID=UPI0012BB455A|nr:phage antirepressor KilAC domain-containing protein [Akkermansia muciniphila]MCL6677142.1 phage antirepressor KilAC domain-containing protein [Akkermansia muciniphila]QIA36153.1 phage antirepressor Ant [Akkermansia muciniphila]BBP48565.1 antirepressor [Akkermansia muciniphila]DAY68325.1 MAG TPA: KilAC domain protein [Caudoviricetes sp.]
MSTIQCTKAQADYANMTGNGIKLFQNSDLNCTIEVIERNGEPWIFAKEVCEALGYSNISKALLNVREKWKGITSRDTLKGKQSVSIINEAGLFALVMKSKMPKAVEFQDWVCEEVLPSIRKHGLYATGEKLEEMLSDPDTMILTLQALKAEREKRKALEAKAAEDAPYAHFGRCVEVSEGCILIGEFAKILAQNGMETGQNRLFEYLRNEGIMGRHGNRHNVPAQEYIEAGYFRLTYRVIQRSDGSQQSKPTPYLTPRGQIWLMKRLGLTLENIPAA